MRAHPRVCGENVLTLNTSRKETGSSPRVRGKREDGKETVMRTGLIPACAGKTANGSEVSLEYGAHPRVCGENIETTVPTYTLRGSSPRVRGKLRAGGLDLLRHGLIPACAGKTLYMFTMTMPAGAHPRVCGENTPFLSSTAASSGSSPRVRGKRSYSIPNFIGDRLIPACAGKTACRLSRLSRTWAHPRVCGENQRPISPLIWIVGSSPRVRGKHPDNPGRNVVVGLIPACAGKTVDFRATATGPRAHPRVCGENTERSGVLTLRSVRSWKTLSFPCSLKVTHCRAFVQLSLSRIRL